MNRDWGGGGKNSHLWGGGDSEGEVCINSRKLIYMKQEMQNYCCEAKLWDSRDARTKGAKYKQIL